MTRRGRFLAGVGGAAVAGMLLTPQRARAAVFAFTCAANNPPDHPATIRLTQMWNAVERESAGRLQVKFYPSGLLGNQGGLMSQLRSGAVDFLHTNPGPIASVVPAADICFLGFAFDNAQQVDRAMEGPLGDYIRKEIAAKGLHACRSVWDNGMYQIGATPHPIVSIDDAQGFKVRVVESRIQVDLFKTLGASPTVVSINDLYLAVQTKLVDGEALPLVNVLTGKLYELQKFVSLTNHVWAGEWLLANDAAWNRLPRDLQGVVERNNTKYAALESSDMSTAYVAELTRRGMTFNSVDPAPFRARLHPYYQAWSQVFGPAAWALVEAAVGRKLG